MIKTTEKKQADVGDLVDCLVEVRNGLQISVNALDEFINKIAQQEAPSTLESTKKETPKFTPQDYDGLPWQTFEFKGKWTGKIGQKFSTAQDCNTRNPSKENLIQLCMKDEDGNEATINTPKQIYGYGYWIFKDWLYRRPMKNPVKK